MYSFNNKQYWGDIMMLIILISIIISSCLILIKLNELIINQGEIKNYLNRIEVAMDEDKKETTDL